MNNDITMHLNKQGEYLHCLPSEVEFKAINEQPQTHLKRLFRTIQRCCSLIHVIVGLI